MKHILGNSCRFIHSADGRMMFVEEMDMDEYNAMNEKTETISETDRPGAIEPYVGTNNIELLVNFDPDRQTVISEAIDRLNDANVEIIERDLIERLEYPLSCEGRRYLVRKEIESFFQEDDIVEFFNTKVCKLKGPERQIQHLMDIIPFCKRPCCEKFKDSSITDPEIVRFRRAEISITDLCLVDQFSLKPEALLRLDTALNLRTTFLQKYVDQGEELSPNEQIFFRVVQLKDTVNLLDAFEVDSMYELIKVPKDDYLQTMSILNASEDTELVVPLSCPSDFYFYLLTAAQKLSRLKLSAMLIKAKLVAYKLLGLEAPEELDSNQVPGFPLPTKDMDFDFELKAW